MLRNTKDKFFDSRKTRDYCDSMKLASKEYERIAGLAFTAYSEFNKNPLFHGITATALKGFISTPVGAMLTEVVDLQDQMVRDQEYLISNFENMVDPHKNARIESNTLEMINTDFKGYYYDFMSSANEVKDLVRGLNNEFGHYTHFPQPDSDSAKSQFEQICGGDNDEAGYFRECQQKLGDFDDVTTGYLKARDTAVRADALGSSIDNTAAALGTYRMGEANADKQTVVKLSAPLFGAPPSTVKGGVVTASPMALTAVSPTLTATMDPSTTMAFEEFLRELESAGASPALIETIIAMIPPALMEPTFWGEVLVGLLVILALAECLPYAIKFIQELERQSEAEAEDGASAGSETGEGEETDEGTDQDVNEKEKAFLENDAEALSNMTRKELEDNLPEGWTYEEHNGRVHIVDENGKMRVRIDEP